MSRQSPIQPTPPTRPAPEPVAGAIGPGKPQCAAPTPVDLSGGAYPASPGVRWWVVLPLGIWAAALAGWQWQTAARRHDEATAAAHQHLVRLARAAQAPMAVRRLAERVAAECGRMPGGGRPDWTRLRAWVQKYPAGAIELHFFDEHGRWLPDWHGPENRSAPVVAWNPDQPGPVQIDPTTYWTDFFAELSLPWSLPHRPIAVRGEEAKALQRLKGLPGEVRPLTGRLFLRAWATWRRVPGNHGGIGAFLLYVHHHHQPTDWLLRRWRQRMCPDLEVGWLNRFRPDENSWPRGVSKRALAAALQRHIIDGRPWREVEGRRVVVAGFDEHLTLCAVVPHAAGLPAAPWWLRLAGVAILAVLAGSSTRSPATDRCPEPIPLPSGSDVGAAPESLRSGLPSPPPLPGIGVRAFLWCLIGVAAVLPMGFTWWSWHQMAIARGQAAEQEALAELERTLIGIDARLPVFRRRFAGALRGWVRQLERTWLNDPDALVPETEAPTDPLVPAVRPGHPWAAAMRRIDRLERDSVLDSVVVVASSGRVILGGRKVTRGWDRLAALPMAVRLEHLAAVHEHLGIDTVDNGLPARMLTIGPITAIASEWRRLRPPIVPADLRALQQIGRRLVQREHERRGTAASNEGLDDLAFDAMIEGIPGLRGLDPIANLLGHLGELQEYRDAVSQGILFVDMVRDRQGHGQFVVFVVVMSSGIEDQYIGDVFARRPGWPTDLQLAAVSLNSEGRHRPWPSVHRRLRALARRTAPPQMVHRAVVRDAHATRLLAALECQHAKGFLLVGTRPWRTVAIEEHRFQLALLLAAIAMVVLVAGLGWRLQCGVAVPVQTLLAGVRAMAAGDCRFRIALDRDDEWGQLAHHFNLTLAGLAELQVAATVQARLLPAAAVTGQGFSFDGATIMAAEIGGDYRDAVVGDDGILTFIVGDVTGHGVSAALVVAIAKAAFGAAALADRATATGILQQIGAVVHGICRRELLMTALVGRAHPDGRLDLASAGHCRPWLCTRAGQTEVPMPPNLPLGVTANFSFSGVSATLEPGDRLFMYTDGVVEAVDARERQFGYQRLRVVVRQLPGLLASAVAGQVVAMVRSFTGSVPWPDDLTVAVLDRLPDSSRSGPA